MKAWREQKKREGHCTVTINPSREESEILRASAIAHGQSMSAHLKTLLMGYLDAEAALPPGRNESIKNRLDGFLAVAKPIGESLNNMARHAHEMHGLGLISVDEVRLHLRRLEDAFQEFYRLVDQDQREQQSQQAGT